MRAYRAYVLRINGRGYYAEDRPGRTVERRKATVVTRRTASRRANKLLRSGCITIEIERK